MNLQAFLLGLAVSIPTIQANATEYPLLDGRCDEYRSLPAKVIARGDGVSVRLFQDTDYVWLCYDLPEGSYGTLDLVVEAPGLPDPLNLHVSAQLGEWRAEHPDEAPQSSDSKLWWKIDGWWANAVSLNGMRDTDEGSRPNFLPSEGRELQISKERFGRGTWRLRFSINAVQTPDGEMNQVAFPSADGQQISVEIF